MNGLVRCLAMRVLSAASLLLPPSLSSWSSAMRRESTEITGEWPALTFAVGCLRAALALAITARLRTLFVRGRTVSNPILTQTRSDFTMDQIWARPRLLGLSCAIGAVALGMAYMIAAGAPLGYPLVNLGALLLGAIAWSALGRVGERVPGAGPAVLVLALLLMATALFGVTVEGASRWVSVGPFSLQISLIVLPAMVVLFARDPDPIGTVGMVTAALALALQPDRAMAGALSMGLVALAFATGSRPAIMAAVAALVAFGWTMFTPDRLLAVAYVDRILYTAFEVHRLAGFAVVIGAAALVLPTVSGFRKQAGDRSILLAFGACWSGVVTAAALGNYPTPWSVTAEPRCWDIFSASGCCRTARVKRRVAASWRRRRSPAAAFAPTCPS